MCCHNNTNSNMCFVVNQPINKYYNALVSQNKTKLYQINNHNR